MAAVSLDGTVAVLDCRENTVKTIMRAGEPLYAIASSADGSQIVCGGASGKLYSASAAGETDKSPIEGESAITTIAVMEDSRQYLVGRADGTLELRSAADLATHAKWLAPGSIWGLDAKGVKDGWLVAVACEARHILILRVLREKPAMESTATLQAPKTIDEPFVYHAVRFAASGEHIRAVDSQARLTQWDLRTKKVDWSDKVLGQDPRRALKPFEQQLPPSLRRAGCLILERPAGELLGREGRPAVGGVGEVARPAPSAVGARPAPSAVGARPAPSAVGARPAPSAGHQLIVAGDDGIIHFLDASRALEANGTTLKVKVGERPRIRFDAEHSDWLWALDRNGLLSVLDCRADACVASRKAHAGKAVDLTVVGNAKVIATVGGDNLMRFWRCENGQIKSARKDIQHDEALISVAASPDGRWVAAVDATARLVVWEYATGRQAFLTRLTSSGHAAGGEEERPLTGRLAFNCDGSRLAAFGAEQIAAVFETPPFRRIPEQVWIAGTGGTAMIWSPTDPEVLMAADDFPRFSVRAFGDAAKATKEPPYAPESTCVAIANTPDGRRVVALEKLGVLRFFEAERLIPLVKLTSTFDESSDLAIDPQGRYLVVTAANGSINLWDVTSRTAKANVRIEDTAGDWTSVPLIEPTAHVIRIQSRMLQTDSRGRVGALYIESKPGDFRNEGALHFVDEDGGYARRQRLEVDDTAYARRASWDSSSFVFGPGGQPVVVFRLRTAVDNPYDGSIQLARRQGRDQWAFETIHEHGNTGFYPLLRLDGAGLPAELLHFSFAGNYLLRSSPGNGDRDQWKAAIVGQQGDGAEMGGSSSADGKLHVVFVVSRFNSDPGMFTYACWDGRELHREVVDPFQSISLPQVQFAPDGSPIVLVGSRLMGQAGNRWAEFATLPISSDRTISPGTESFAVDRKGDVLFVYLEPASQRVVLCEGHKDSWSTKAIAHFADGPRPNFCTLRLGANGESVVVVGCINEPYGWLRILRRKR